MKLSIKKYSELQVINDKALELANMKFILTYKQLSDIWEASVYLNKISNQSEANECVKWFEVMDEETKSLKWFTIKGHHNYSKDQFAALLIGLELYLTKQQLNTLLK